MKTIKFLTIAAAAAMVAVSCETKGTPAENGAEGAAETTSEVTEAPKTLKELTPKKSEIDTVSYLVGLNFGSFIKGYDFGNLNYSQIKKGIDDFLKSTGNFGEPGFNEQFKVNPERMNDIFNSFLAKRREYVALENKEKEAAYLAKSAAQDSVQVTESGLQYIIREAGNEVKPTAQDTVFVNYKGTLIDGTVFDQSNTPNGIQMNLNMVIKGWTEGLQLIGEGGKMKLIIPSELGYGAQGNRGIAPNSTLLFDIELVSVKKFVPKEEEAKAE